MSDIIKLGTIYLSEEGDAVSAFALDGAQLAQVVPLFRAATVQAINRGNRTRTITFTRTRRPHASAEAARLFLADHDKELEGITADDCVLTFRVGGSDYSRTLKDAVVTSHRGEQIGLTTRHTYTLVGGAFINTP
jgi:hypothetical protein